MWYDVAPGEEFHDIVIELEETALAVIPVGVAGGRGFVVADAMFDGKLVPLSLIADT